MSNEVSLPRGVVAAGVVVVIVLVGAVAFLLGRESRDPTVALAPDPAPPTTTPTTTAPTTIPPLPPPATEPVPEPVPAPDPTPPPTPTPTTTTTTDPAAEQEAVRGYFSRIELELASAKDFSDANAAAMKALEDLSGSGVRTMQAEQQRLRDKVAAVAPPPPCVEHHRALLAALDGGIAMLGNLAAKMSSNDTASLGKVSDDARRVEASARAVDAIAAALKKKYGL